MSHIYFNYMKNIYTRHQIIESIKHWKNVLKELDKSKSPLLDIFVIKPVKQMQESVNEENVIFSDDDMTIEKTADENINVVHMY